jgi:hypothetical protein
VGFGGQPIFKDTMDIVRLKNIDDDTSLKGRRWDLDRGHMKRQRSESFDVLQPAPLGLL